MVDSIKINNNIKGDKSMNQIKEKMEERKKYLLQLKKEKLNEIKNVPGGKLRISSHGNRTQYYQRKDSKDINGSYIKDKNLAKKLAQKEYDKRVIGLAEKELYAIQKFFFNYPEINVEEFYKTLHCERQKLIIPVEKPLEQFIEEWKNIEYQGKGFMEDFPEYYTAKGERVRSKSELIIADFFEREGILYHYERPLLLKNFGVVYPDFTVLNIRNRKEYYWEHLGMMDEPDYAEKAIQKIMTYQQNGYFPGENLICTYETRKISLNQKNLKMMVERYLR